MALLAGENAKLVAKMFDHCKAHEKNERAMFTVAGVRGLLDIIIVLQNELLKAERKNKLQH